MLFINLCTVITSPHSLLSFSVVRCISFSLSSYVRFSNSGTILVAILCILSNFNTFFLDKLCFRLVVGVRSWPETHRAYLSTWAITCHSNNLFSDSAGADVAIMGRGKMQRCHLHSIPEEGALPSPLAEHSTGKLGGFFLIQWSWSRWESDLCWKLTWMRHSNYFADEGVWLFGWQESDDDEISHLEWETVRVRFLKAGTLERLVESLASDTGELESTFVNVFLATYRTFSSTRQVLNLIIDRYLALQAVASSSSSSSLSSKCNKKVNVPPHLCEDHMKWVGSCFQADTH